MNNHENILILTALQLEALPLVKKLKASRDPNVKNYLRYVDPTDRITIVVTGVGWHQATEVFAQELKMNVPDHTLITGICGGLNPIMQLSYIHTPTHVITRELPPLQPTWALEGAKGTLLTTQRILTTPTEKQEAYQTYGTDTVDMETYHLATMCNERQIPWAMMRVVSDDSQTTLPTWLATLTHNDGRANIKAAIKCIIRHPRAISTLLKMQQSTKSATLALSTKVASILADILK